MLPLPAITRSTATGWLRAADRWTLWAFNAPTELATRRRGR